MKTKRLFLLFIFAALLSGKHLAKAQQVTLGSPQPSPIAQISARTSGATGNGTDCYWVVAIFPIGQALSQSSCVSRVGFNNGGTVVITWGGVAQATGYNLLRTSASVFPASGTCTNCLLLSNTTAVSATDTGASLGSFTLSLAPAAASTIYIDNLNYSLPRIIFPNYQVGVQGLWFPDGSNLTTATGGVGGLNQLTGDVLAGPGTGSQPATLATVNSGPGLCGDSTHVCQITTNGKGLVTLQTPVGVAGGSGITQLTGDTIAGPGSGSVPSVNKSFATDVNATSFAACDGITDDTAAFTTMSSLAVNIHIGAGLTCLITNPTISSHTHIWGGPGSRLLRGLGSTASYMLTASSKTDVGLHNLIIDGNGVTQTTANLFYVFLTGTSNFIIENCIFQNSNTPPASMGAITAFNGPGLIRNNNIKSTILGYGIVNDSNSTAANRVQILGNTISGSTTGGIWIQNSGSEGVCPVEVAGNRISSIGDSAADAGQTGNAIKVYQCDSADVHDNTSDTTRYSGVRVTASSGNDIHDNTINAASETAIYCTELGGANNHCHDNHIFNSMSGINATNVSSRSPDATNKIDNNDCTNVAYYCVYGEHDVVENNRADGVPFPFIIGNGSTSHDNVLKSNVCTLGSASYYPVDVCAGIDVGMLGTNTVSGNLYAGSTSITITPVMATNTPSNIVVTAITQAATAAVSYSSGSQPANNSTVCFAQVAGMTQINGLCGTVSSSTASTFSVGINTSTFSAFLATPANGTAPKAQGIEVYSSGTTPYQAFTTHVAMANQTIAFLYLSTMANGSSVYLSDGTVGTTCAGSGTGSAAVLNAGTWNCFGGGGSSGVSVEISGGAAVGPKGTLNFIPGTGLAGFTGLVNGSNIDITLPIDTSYLNTNYVKRSTPSQFTEVLVVPAANCSPTAGAGWSIGSGGTVTCRAGTNNLGGYIAITDTSTTFATFQIALPEDWDTAQNPYIRFQLASADATNGHTVIPEINVACYKGDGSTTDDVAPNGLHSLSTVTLNGNAHRFWSTSNVQMNSTDVTGCVAGALMQITVGRASDTAADAEFYSATVTIPRLLTLQAN